MVSARNFVENRTQQRNVFVSFALLKIVLLALCSLAIVHITKPTVVWTNKFDVVHVVETDFLQYNLELDNLNNARLGLFETFTVPSVQQQSNTEFLWLIFTDPNLSKANRYRVVEIVKTIPNAVVLAHRRSKKHDFRDLHGMTKGEVADSIVVGSHELIFAYWKASQERVLLETRLDADDSLNLNFVESIQLQASHTLAKSDLSNDYRVYCPLHHSEWRYYRPENETATTGHLVHHFNPTFCINSGLTIGYQTSAKSRHLITVEQCNMNQWYETCQDDADGGDTINHYCVGRVRMVSKHSDHAVLVARTPTSAGMKRVLGSEKTYKSTFESVEAQKGAWKMIAKAFGVRRSKILSVRRAMENNIERILHEALQGQCMPGHSCKAETKRKLLKLIQKKRSKREAEAAEKAYKKFLQSRNVNEADLEA